MMLPKSAVCVLDRISALEAIFQDLKSAVIRDGQNAKSFVASSDARAALIVGSRALNLFISNYIISEHLEPQLMQLNSYMIRLSSDGPDCLIAYTKLVYLLDQVLVDIDNFRSSFTTEMPKATPPISTQVDSDLESTWSSLDADSEFDDGLSDMIAEST